MKHIKHLLSFVFFCIFALSAEAVTINYTADNTSIFPNPERGFISQLSKTVTEADCYVVKGRESYLTTDKRLVLVLYYLDNYKNTATLPNVLLDAFDEDMQALRSNGYKCILRYAYTDTHGDNGSGEDTGIDASLSIVQSHINQLKSHWQANADVIYVVQAGFVGTYGEWYYTSNFDNKKTGMNADRKAVVEAMLAAMPSNRYILLRTPAHKIGFMGDEDALTYAQSFSGSNRARLGHYNDAVLNFPGDAGTYSIQRSGDSYPHTDTATLKPYIAQETLYVPIGGESNVTSESAAAENATFAKTTAEFSRMHWSFCKGGWPEAVVNKWKTEGTYDELDRKLGYRYQLVSATLPDAAAKGENVDIHLQIRNTGYAPLYNERHVYIVFKNSMIGTYMVQLQADPRRWLPNGAVSNIDETIAMPDNIPAGTYSMYLYMPDAADRLASDSRYSVRFANTGVWVETTGMNKLNTQVEVESDIQPEAPNAIALPATLNKANVTSYSPEMTWYNTDYFDFGPTDALNTNHWAEWDVYLQYPGKYIVSEVMKSAPNSNNTGLLSHQWQLTLVNDDGDILSTYIATKTTAEGTLNNEVKWDLSGVSANVYKLRVRNITEWGQPKLRSLTLSYDGTLPTPTSVEQTALLDRSQPMYDMLGRQVSPAYRGLVIQNGKKYITGE